MLKGEIWWAHLPSPRGSEPAKKRPVIILQNDNINHSDINTIICAVITSNIRLAGILPNILLEKANSGLEKTSVINFSQIITIDKSFMTEWVYMVSKQFIEKIDNSLKVIFDIK